MLQREAKSHLENREYSVTAFNARNLSICAMLYLLLSLLPAVVQPNTKMSYMHSRNSEMNCMCAISVQSSSTIYVRKYRAVHKKKITKFHICTTSSNYKALMRVHISAK